MMRLQILPALVAAFRGSSAFVLPKIPPTKTMAFSTQLDSLMFLSAVSDAALTVPIHEMQEDETVPVLDGKEKPQSPLASPNPLESAEKILRRDIAINLFPLQVDDENLLFYDVFLLINLSVSISFWVTHRMQFDFVGAAFNEGCLLALCWVAAGLWNGAFLRSAVDGHHRSTDDRAGPQAAGLLALNTFVGTTNLRLLWALLVAMVEHRPALSAMGGEELMPLELGCGVLLMIAWRALHSSITPRI